VHTGRGSGVAGPPSAPLVAGSTSARRTQQLAARHSTQPCFIAAPVHGRLSRAQPTHQFSASPSITIAATPHHPSYCPLASWVSSQCRIWCNGLAVPLLVHLQRSACACCARALGCVFAQVLFLSPLVTIIRLPLMQPLPCTFWLVRESVCGARSIGLAVLHCPVAYWLPCIGARVLGVQLVLQGA
jgi:hypothetical protein